MLKIFKKLFKKIYHWSFDTAKFDIDNIGTNVVLAPGLNITHPKKVFFGDNIYIGPNAFLSSYGTIIIESGVIIGPNITIYTANHNYENAVAIPYDGKVILKMVKIEKNVWIGGNVIIIPGVTIAEGSIIGAGSVITKNVPKYAIMGGNPAKILRYRNEEEYEKLKRSGSVYMDLKQKAKIEYLDVNFSD